MVVHSVKRPVKKSVKAFTKALVFATGSAFLVLAPVAANTASSATSVSANAATVAVNQGQQQSVRQRQNQPQTEPRTEPRTEQKSTNNGNDDFDRESAALLEERISYWYERGRPDRIENVLQQLLRVHPNHPRIIEVQALLAVQQRDMARAQSLYRQLQQQAPNHNATARLRELVGLPNEQSNALTDARMLTLAGRHPEAFTRLQEVFPEGPQNLELALEYWESAVRAGLTEGEALINKGLNNLERLQRQNPNSIRTELTLMRVKLSLNTLTRNDYQRLAALSRDTVYGQEASGLLVRSATALDASEANYGLMRIAREALPKQAELAEADERMRDTLEAEITLANNPNNQQKMRGLQALENENPRAAEGWLREALQGMPNDAEIMGGLGYATLRQGRQDEALSWFRRASEADPESAQWQELIVSTTFWRDVDVFDRLLEENELRRANIMLGRIQGHPSANEQTALVNLREARLAEAEGNTPLAYERYQQVLALQPDNSSAAWALLGLYRDNTNEQGMRALYAQLTPELQSELASEYNRFLANQYQARADALIAEGDIEGAHATLLAAYELTPGNPWLVYSLALSYEERNELPAAEAAFQRLQQLNPSEDTRFAYALFLARQDRDEEARESLAAIESEAFSEGMQALALRLDERSLQTGGAVSSQATNPDLRETVLYVGFDRSAKSGTPGITELTAETIMIDLRVPFSEREGYWFVRVDPMRINAGEADLDDNFWRNRFGTGLLCETDCPSGIQPEAEETGVAFGVGAEFSDWWFDIGTSPVGFNRSEWVGGIGMRRSVGEFGLRLNANRRIQTATMISFSGMQDPFATQPGESQDWGAVTRNGVGLGLSWDQGGALGWWSSLGYDYYTGHNVKSNSRWYGYTGGYWRAFDREPFALTLGLTYLSWGFNEDLSQPTFGHGNYYSPEFYHSLSLPITIFGRYKRFSYLLRGSIGYSDTELAEQVFYPGHPRLQEQGFAAIDNTGINPVWDAGTGGGLSHSLTGNFEYKVTKALYVGLSVNLVRSDTFSPDQGLLYLRYHFGGNDLPPARPPDPPNRYVDR